MTVEELKAMLNNIPIKTYLIASICGIHPSQFSKCINNDREWPEEQFRKVSKLVIALKDTITKFKQEEGVL